MANKPESFEIIGPDGMSLTVTKEVYRAVEAFIKSEDPISGSVTLHFAASRIASVESLTKKVYKY